MHISPLQSTNDGFSAHSIWSTERKNQIGLHSDLTIHITNLIFLGVIMNIRAKILVN